MMLYSMLHKTKYCNKYEHISVLIEIMLFLFQFIKKKRRSE